MKIQLKFLGIQMKWLERMRVREGKKVNNHLCTSPRAWIYRVSHYSLSCRKQSYCKQCQLRTPYIVNRFEFRIFNIRTFFFPRRISLKWKRFLCIETFFWKRKWNERIFGEPKIIDDQISRKLYCHIFFFKLCEKWWLIRIVFQIESFGFCSIDDSYWKLYLFRSSSMAKVFAIVLLQSSICFDVQVLSILIKCVEFAVGSSCIAELSCRLLGHCLKIYTTISVEFEMERKKKELNLVFLCSASYDPFIDIPKYLISP